MLKKIQFSILFFSILLFCNLQVVVSQDKIELERAGSLEGAIINGQNVKKLKNNVSFRQGDTKVYCDSAYFFSEINVMEAFGHVKIVQKGTTITSEYLKYYGDTKLLHFDGNVFLKDKSMTLSTPALDYNTKTKEANYDRGGTIIDKSAKLTSDIGFYNMELKKFIFKRNVKLLDKDYDLQTDTLIYLTDDKVAIFKGPTKIKNKEGLLNSNDGEYSTDKHTLKLKGKSQIENNEMILVGDTVNFNQKKQEGTARGNVIITLKKDKTIIEGDRCEYKSKTKETKVWGNVLMKSFMEDDTLFLKSQNLFAVNDSTKKNRKLTAFPKVSFFRKDVQGKCDSLIYNLQDSILFFYKKPIIWANKSQMTGDTIKIQMVKNKIDKLFLRSSAFIISEDSLKNHNQIKGKRVTAFFKENKIQTVDVFGNGESLYFATENDTILTGMNKVICSNMLMRFKESKLNTISFLTKPEANFIPPQELTDPTKKLKGFTWRIAEIPSKGFMLDRKL